MTTYRKKMIEVALPLDAINKASAREKSIRHGHPSTLHLWWARRPLAACRSVLFSSLVNDPSDDPMYGVDEDTAATERAKLFDLIEDLVLWENSNNPDVINRARLEIARSIAANKVADGELEDDAPLVANAPELPEEQAKYLPDPPAEYTPKDVRFKAASLKPEQVNHFLAHYAPPVLDPFAGGGSIPLEAQRLGLRAYASDLNPVPVLINKAMIEIPPRFAGQPPVNPEAQQGKLATKVWNRAEGLAEDVRYYGKWMRDEAEKRIGHLYPKVKVTQQMVDDGRPDLEPYVGQELTVIAWIWCRTVPSPNPAVGQVQVPLIRSFWLSKKKGQEAYIFPNVDRNAKQYSFEVKVGTPEEFDPANGLVSRKGGRCLLSDAPMPFPHIRSQGQSGNLSVRLMAIVAQAGRRRIYLNATAQHEETGLAVDPEWSPPDLIPNNPRDFKTPNYGIETFGELFTSRQAHSLATHASMLETVYSRIVDDSTGSGTDVEAYARAVTTFLGMTVSRTANSLSTLSVWSTGRGQSINAFGRQALPMTWDFPEVNPFAGAAGDFGESVVNVAKTIENLPANGIGFVEQRNAIEVTSQAVISTDPPYYDNISYADLSDFFYVWLRKGLQSHYPQLFGTMLSPKSDELIASPYRHDGNREAASEFFELGLSKAIARWRTCGRANYPVTIFYAFKQAETDSDGTSSTGWETFLSAVIENEYTVTATWPMRTERDQGLKTGNNVLASSVVLACVPRAEDALMVTRRDFANTLRKELPEAIKHLQSGNVAPVDLAQASIGPGMAVFSRYSKVVNADGSPMSVREALQLINQVLDESLVEQESDFDAETRFALNWFEQYGMDEGPFGDAETLAKAKAVSVGGIEESGIAKSASGKFRLLKRDELEEDWDPRTDQRLVKWEITQHLIKTLETDGETGAASLLKKAGPSDGEIARELAYRLYQTCEKKKLAEEARAYNTLVVSWPEILKLSAKISDDQPKQQTDMFKKK